MVDTTGGVLLVGGSESKINVIPGCNKVFMDRGLVVFDITNDTIYDLYVNFNIYCGPVSYDYHIPPGQKMLKAVGKTYSVNKAIYSGGINIWAQVAAGGYPPVNFPANQVTIVGYSSGNYGPPQLVPMNRVSNQGNVIFAQGQTFREEVLATGGVTVNFIGSQVPVGQSLYVKSIDLTGDSPTTVASGNVSIANLDAQFTNAGIMNWRITTLQSGESRFDFYRQFDPPVKGTTSDGNAGTTILSFTVGNCNGGLEQRFTFTFLQAV